jgi:hypothetical protein
VNVDFPFQANAAGHVYAKVLVTPRNAVNPGQPNGTVSSDYRAGQSGWWVAFALLQPNGQALGTDARGMPVPASLGAYVDSTPTPLVAVAAGTSYLLRMIIHVPAQAWEHGAEHHAIAALAFRGGDGDLGGISGAMQDASLGLITTFGLQGATLGGIPAPGPGIGAGSGSGAPATPPAGDWAPFPNMAALVLSAGAVLLLVLVLLALLGREVRALRREVALLRAALPGPRAASPAWTPAAAQDPWSEAPAAGAAPPMPPPAVPARTAAPAMPATAARIAPTAQSLPHAVPEAPEGTPPEARRPKGPDRDPA